MAAFWFNRAKKRMADAEIDWASADIRAMLIMRNSTVPTEYGADTCADFTTLNEHDGASYGGAVALTGKTSTEIDPTLATGYTSLDANDITFPTQADDGTENGGVDPVAGVLVYLHTGPNLVDKLPLIWHPAAGTPDGQDYVVTWNSDGVGRVRGTNP